MNILNNNQSEPQTQLPSNVLPDKWSKDYDKCEMCGGVEKKHRANGLCYTCYFKQYRKDNPELIQQARNKWANNNKHRLKMYAKEYRQRKSEGTSV